MALKGNPFENDMPVGVPKAGTTRRRRVFEEPEELEALRADAHVSQNSVQTVSQALVSHHAGVSSVLDINSAGVSQTLVSHHAGVSSALDKTAQKIGSALGQALVRRHVGVRKVENSALDFDALIGDEKTLLLFVGTQCRQLASLETNWINSEELKKLFSLGSNDLRNLIFRVKRKGYFQVESRQLGRVGLRKFKLKQEVYQKASALVSHHAGVSSALGQALGQALVEPPSSSRDLIIKESTTTQPHNSDSTQQNPVNLINVDALNKFGIGHDTVARAFQLNPALRQDQVEDLISRFAQYAGDPKNKIQNARGFFLELAKQAASGITPLDHIESDSERMLREYVERQQEARSRRNRLEKEALELEFENWISTLTSEDRNNLVPAQGIFSAGSIPQTMKLKEYFRENIWAKRRIEIESNALRHQNNESD